MNASNEGSCKTVQVHRLVLALTARKCDQFQNLMCWFNCFLTIIQKVFFSGVVNEEIKCLEMIFCDTLKFILLLYHQINFLPHRDAFNAFANRADPDQAALTRAA